MFSLRLRIVGGDTSSGAGARFRERRGPKSDWTGSYQHYPRSIFTMASAKHEEAGIVTVGDSHAGRGLRVIGVSYNSNS